MTLIDVNVLIHSKMTGTPKVPAFAQRAERALRRATRTVETQSRALQLPVIVWQDGRVVERPA